MEKRADILYYTIPAVVMHDNDLTDSEKILYAEISGLCNAKGYCWATNGYLADLFATTERTISARINNLRKKNYITIESADKEGTFVKERRIRIPLARFNDPENIVLEDESNDMEENVNTRSVLLPWKETSIPEGIFHHNNKYIKENDVKDLKDIDLKEKESKEKENRTKLAQKKMAKAKLEKQAEEIFNILCDQYPNNDGRSTVKMKTKLLLLNYPLEKLIEAQKLYIRKTNEKGVNYKNASTFYNQEAYKDYFDDTDSKNALRGQVKLENADKGFDAMIKEYGNTTNYETAKNVWMAMIVSKQTEEEQQLYAKKIYIATKAYARDNSSTGTIKYRTYDKWLRNDCENCIRDYCDN